VIGGCHHLEDAHVAVAPGSVRGLRARHAYGEARERAAERRQIGRRYGAAWHHDWWAARRVNVLSGSSTRGQHS
jgi:hypothetical protein